MVKIDKNYDKKNQYLIKTRVLSVYVFFGFYLHVKQSRVKVQIKNINQMPNTIYRKAIMALYVSAVDTVHISFNHIFISHKY